MELTSSKKMLFYKTQLQIFQIKLQLISFVPVRQPNLWLSNACNMRKQKQNERYFLFARPQSSFDLIGLVYWSVSFTSEVWLTRSTSLRVLLYLRNFSLVSVLKRSKDWFQTGSIIFFLLSLMNIVNNFSSCLRNN